MEIKGRVIQVFPIENRVKKDGTGSYRIFNINIQIGKHKRTKADFKTQTFYEVEEPDVVTYSYLNEQAEQAAQQIHQGDVVFIDLWNRVNAHGYNEVIVNKVTPARPQAEIKQPSEPARTNNDTNDSLPF